MPRNTAFTVRCTVAIVATVALGACSDGPSVASGTDPVPAGSTITTTPPPIPGARSCADPSPIHATDDGLEAQGKMRGRGSVYVLFAGVDTLTAGTPIAAYWRLGGERALRVTLVGPDDRITHASGVRPGVPAFAWDRPGEPWRSELTFPEAGCWRLYVERAGADGEVWVRVT